MARRIWRNRVRRDTIGRMNEPSDVITPTETNSVWAERTGTRRYLAHNARGAEVAVGMGPGEFTPGELLKVALATCNTLSADHRLLTERVRRAIDRGCTVGHTLDKGAAIRLHLLDDEG